MPLDFGVELTFLNHKNRFDDPVKIVIKKTIVINFLVPSIASCISFNYSNFHCIL